MPAKSPTPPVRPECGFGPRIVPARELRRNDPPTPTRAAGGSRSKAQQTEAIFDGAAPRLVVLRERPRGAVPYRNTRAAWAGQVGNSPSEDQRWDGGPRPGSASSRRPAIQP